MNPKMLSRLITMFYFGILTGCGIFENDNDYFNLDFMFKNSIFKVDISLKDDDKIHLVEIMLIVGALLTAFQLPTNLIWIFMLFVD